MTTRWMVLTAVLASTVAAAPAVRAAGDLSGSLQIKGSDTMVNLCQAWAEAFMQRYPNVNIAVTGGGSGTGIAALIGGTCELASSSRQMTDKEKAQANAKGHAPHEDIVARDGLAVVVNPKNSVRQLTMAQLAGIFTGTITTWEAVGGPRKAIVLLSREVNSGTHVYFKEHILGKQEFAPSALLMPSSQAIADEIAANPYAIGYYGMGYSNPNNAVMAVAKTDAGPYVPPTVDNVRAGTYPIARPLFVYSAGAPQGVVKAFLAFAMSTAGQQIVQQNDFVPVQ